jgi:hypothetical protein
MPVPGKDVLLQNFPNHLKGIIKGAPWYFDDQLIHP